MRVFQSPFSYLALYCALELAFNGRLVKFFRFTENAGQNVTEYSGEHANYFQEEDALLEELTYRNSTKRNYTALPRSPTVIFKEPTYTNSTKTNYTKLPRRPTSIFRGMFTGKQPEVHEGEPVQDPTSSTEISAAVATESKQHPRYQAPTPNFYQPTGPETWFYLHSANEGMSNWKRSWAQMVSVAKGVGAVIVEPCVARGMLRTCDPNDPGITTAGTVRDGLPTGMVPLREVFDIQVFLDYHPKIVPYEDFLRYSNYSTDMPFREKICLSRNVKWDTHICLAQGIPNHMMGKGIHPIDTVLWATRDLNQTSVLEVYDLWRNGIASYAWGCKKRKCRNPQAILGDWLEFEGRMRFPKHQYDNVEAMLVDLLPNRTRTAEGKPNFGALQWRPETKAIPYVGCAHAIVQARDLLAEQYGIPKENFLLMTPLSERTNLVWDGVQGGANGNEDAVHEAFDYMRSNGIQRLEDVHSMKDGTLPAVWDFISAALATTYSTCKRCKGRYCWDCNYAGGSASFSMVNRNAYRKESKLVWWDTTQRCWAQQGMGPEYLNDG